tara:strand:+ start:1774 stop:2490 length:717 start_codon:yes stop_codon:yes gene_type:complete
MVKRTYTTKQSGTSSTNRFVERNYIPTKVVTGATTTPAKLQPNLTGKPLKPKRQDSDRTPPETPPVNYEKFTERELANITLSGFPGGPLSPESLAVKAAGAALGPFGSALVTGGTLATMYGGREHTKARMARDADFDFLNPGKNLQNRQRDITQRRQRVLDYDYSLLDVIPPGVREAFNATQQTTIEQRAAAETQALKESGVTVEDHGGVAAQHGYTEDTESRGWDTHTGGHEDEQDY